MPLKQVHQPEYGNEVLYAETSKADKGEYKFSVDYDVVRREHVVLVNGKPVTDAPSAKMPRVELARFLEPDRLVPVTGLPAQLAAQETKGATTPLEKAKDIYEYVFRTMKYDKSGAGWGHGDTLWACDSKHGNCTDFHSVFISMARAEKIPARFQIGFPLPADKHSAEIPGYHCWAEFYLDSTGWVPVDISEAWKHQEKHDYFFGAHDVNRVQFTAGTRSETRAGAGGSAAELFCLSVCGDRREGISECFDRVLVRGCRSAPRAVAVSGCDRDFGHVESGAGTLAAGSRSTMLCDWPNAIGTPVLECFVSRPAGQRSASLTPA